MIKELTIEKTTLPADWEIKKLGEVCDLKSGKTISKSIERSEGEILYIKVGDMNLIGNENYIQFSNRFVDKSDINSNQIIPIGSIIFPKRGGAIATNKKRRIAKPTIVDLNTMALVPSKIVDENYLFHWFQKIDLAELSNGANIPQINNYSFDDVSISYPKSIAQQKKIVAILDKAFAAIDTAKANAEQNLQNAKELFESYLQNVFENKGDAWEKKTLQEVCHKITDGTHQTPKYFDEGVIFLSSRNVTSGKINWDKIKYIDEKQHIEMHKRIAPKIGDILLAKNGTTGVAAMVDKDVVFDIYVSLAHIRSLGNVYPEFLLYFINSPVAKKQFNSRLKGAGVPNLHLKEIREVVINFPKSIREQKTIVNKLDAISSESKKLEAIYKQKIADLEEMKNSVLQKAFSGQLNTIN